MFNDVIIRGIVLKKKNKIILYIAAAIIIIAIIYFLFPFAVMLCTKEGRASIDVKVRSYGVFAPIIFVGIEILQIVAAIIPGAPIEAMGGVLFGGFWGIIWCFCGIFIGTAIVFFLVRRFGRPLVYKIFSEDKLNNIRLLNDERKLTATIFILFLIPGTPKDFLTYIAGLTKIKPSKFFFTAALARTPSMACSVFMGANIGEGRFLTGLIILSVVIVLSIVGYFIKKKYVDGKLIKYGESDMHSQSDNEKGK